MRSRRDQVQAYGYVVGRLSSALVHGEPDAVQTPMRRTTTGTVGGVMLGALGVVAFLIWGLISPVSKAAAAPTAGDLIVVSQTGASYIYTGGKLQPVLNWASARLLLNGSPQVQDETAAALASIPQGPPLGIVGAPDALPSRSAVNQGDWLVCAQSSGGKPGAAVSIGAHAAASGQSDRAILVAVGGTRYLIWQGQRMRLDAPWIAQALGLGQAPVTQVSSAWLNAVPAGPALRPFSLPGTGSQGPVLGGQRTRVGEVLSANNVGSSDVLYLVESGGVAEIPATQAALDLASGGTAAAYPGTVAAPVAVSPAAIPNAPVAHQPLPDGAGVPADPPHDYLGSAGDVPCMAYPSTGTGQPSLIWAAPLGGSAPDLSAPGVSPGAADADLISVAPGGGALVQTQTAGGSSLFLVTDSGVKFPVPNTNAATALGYQAGQAAQLPAALLGLLPTGPSLYLAPLQASQG
jgi:type VII secretion protein EccB